MEITGRLARGVLADAEFVHLAVEGRHGPHVTPLVFGSDSERIWFVTPRDAAKVRAMRRHRRVGGVAVHGRRAVAFTGRAEIVDPLRGKSGGSLGTLLELPLAMTGYLGRNLGHVGGIVRARGLDPGLLLGRVVVSIRFRTAALVVDGSLVREWGHWPGRSAQGPGGLRLGEIPRLDDVPARCRRLLTARPAPAVLGWLTAGGPVAVPAAWDPADGRAGTDPALLRLVGATAGMPVSLTLDEGGSGLDSKHGVLVQGRAEAGRDSDATLHPERVTWWRGDASRSLPAVNHRCDPSPPAKSSDTTACRRMKHHGGRPGRAAGEDPPA